MARMFAGSSLAPLADVPFCHARSRPAGDQRIQVQLTSVDQSAPITKEEITRLYADR
jgi:hypothetical protein